MSLFRILQGRKLPIASLQYDAGTLTLDGWPADAVASLFQGIPWVWDARVGRWRCDAYHYAAVSDILRICQLDVVDEIHYGASVTWPEVQLPNLRLEQQRAIDAWNKTCRGVVIMPTGTGKTEVALQLMAHTACNALIVAPVRDLMYQWHRRILRGLGYDAGILGDSQSNVRPVTVTTYASACIHMPQLGDRFELLVFDECHHLSGPLRSDSEVERELMEDWGDEGRQGWRLIREGEILHRGQRVFLPDFVLEHDDGRRVLFEIAGFWTPEYIAHKAEVLQLFADNPILVAIPKATAKRWNDIPLVPAHRRILYRTRPDIESILQAIHR